jgi:hypothetical protein
LYFALTDVTGSPACDNAIAAAADAVDAVRAHLGRAQ